MAKETPWSGEVLSVSEVIEQARQALDLQIGRVAIEGEVFEYRGPHSSGHYYFKLRDPESSLEVKMWRGVAARGMRCELQEGRTVLAFGRFDIWSKRGSLSFLLDQVDDLGAGDLARRFEELKLRLRAEGLFEESRKLPLPVRPLKVALISAIPSAAAADIQRTFDDLHAPFRVLEFPCAVQGEGAATQLAQAIARASAAQVDVILLARGGGSLEDLWAFNQEILVRAIAATSVPVVSAVGHEVDFTLCDFVADKRAKTPTAGAALLCADWLDARRQLLQMARRLPLAMQAQLSTAKIRQRESACQLPKAIAQATLAARAQMQTARAVLHAQAPGRRLERYRRQIHQNELRFSFASQAMLKTALSGLTRQARRLHPAPPAQQQLLFRQQLQALQARLQAGSPQALLQRGYALIEIEGQDGFLRDSLQAEKGASLKITLAKGHLRATVEQQENSPQ
jgi:exodeoxyribonuclease VII large subunit